MVKKRVHFSIASRSHTLYTPYEDYVPQRSLIFVSNLLRHAESHAERVA
ncbi:hypothetical protein EV213_103207 [Aureibacillus halotolerans]|uniref:Uncharacterized protein n=1 Tax=Aureibacillus halotolerans TaxID=1508390 RepID=A0A4R6U588_9BACI|nr:hypothetical protein EV213_103207 [Aureibacillus halotolerans]